MNPTEDVLTDEDMGMTDEQMGVQGLENFAPIGEKAIAGAAVGADPYQFQKPDVLAGFNNENNQKMAQQNIDGVKAMLYGIPNIGPAIPDALDAVGIGENNQESWSKAAEDYAPVTAMSSIVSPSPVGKMGVAARIGGAGVDAAQRATDQGESPTGWGLAGAAMQGLGEGAGKLAGMAATKIAPHVDDVANVLLSRFLGLEKDQISRLRAEGQLGELFDVLRMGDNPVLKNGQGRQGAYNAAKSLEQQAITAKGNIPHDYQPSEQLMASQDFAGVAARDLEKIGERPEVIEAVRRSGGLNDVQSAEMAIENAGAVRSGIGKYIPSGDNMNHGLRTGWTAPFGAAFDAVGGQRIQSTAGLGAKDIAQKILANPQLMSNPNAYGAMNGRIMRFLQIVQDSDNPEVEMEIGMQDPELARYMNEVRKDNK